MLFVRGAKQLLTLRGRRIRRGSELSDLGVIPDGGVLIDGDRIEEVGSTRRLDNLTKARHAKVIDASGKVVMPSFADPRTRLVFSASALRDFDRLIAAATGRRDGPNLPVRSLMSLRSERRLSPKSLRLNARRWLFMAACYGSTAVEIRAGQGLDAASELRALRIIRSLEADPLEVRGVYLAGRSLDEREAIGSCAARVARAVERSAARKFVYAVSIDRGPRGLDSSLARAMARQAASLGLAIKVDAHRAAKDSAAIRFAVEHGALSVDGADHADDAEIRLLAQAPIVVTFTPGLVYHRGGKDYPSARRLLDNGVAVALATGFGPDSSPTLSMPMAMALACRQMGMTPEEAIVAATINAAAALGRADALGSLEPGKQADLAFFDVGDYREIPFYFG